MSFTCPLLCQVSCTHLAATHDVGLQVALDHPEIVNMAVWLTSTAWFIYAAGGFLARNSSVI
jgi:hypothetical protein